MTHPENPTETNSTSANLTITTVDGRSFSLETDSASRFQFLSPQNLKNSNWQAKNPDSDKKNPDPSENFLDLGKKTQIQAIFHVNPASIWSNLAKSHRFRWDFRRS